jgi:hypothetical protein
MKLDHSTWKSELLFTGRIVQDGDKTVDPDEAHRRFLRYIELVEEVDGSEGADALVALFQSVQMKDDYGAYQTTYRIMGRFPDELFAKVFVQELPSLILRQPDWAGDFLVGIANGQGGKWDYQIKMFNDAVAAAPAEVQRPIIDYIREQELSGWFRHRVGVLCPGS